VLRILDITARLALTDAPFHNLHWQSSFELSLDCFICERVGRTTIFTVGDEQAVCTGDRAKTGRHFTAARVAGFDVDSRTDELVLQVVVNRWWAPFHDQKRKQDGQTVGRASWVRFGLAYSCPDNREPGSFGVQSNMTRPAAVTCRHCAKTLGRSEQTPLVIERP
jgi:hypothetical protein